MCIIYIQVIYSTLQTNIKKDRLLKKAPLEVRHNKGGSFFFFRVQVGSYVCSTRWSNRRSEWLRVASLAPAPASSGIMGGSSGGTGRAGGAGGVGVLCSKKWFEVEAAVSFWEVVTQLLIGKKPQSKRRLSVYFLGWGGFIVRWVG